MKRILLFFSIFITAIMGKENVNKIESLMQITKEHIQTCVDTTIVTRQDLRNFSQIIAEDLQIEDLDDPVWKASCYYACLSEITGLMKGGRINMPGLTSILHFQRENNTHGFDRNLAEIYHKCGQRANRKTGPCEVMFQYLSCVEKEKRLQNIQQ